MSQLLLLFTANLAGSTLSVGSASGVGIAVALAAGSDIDAGAATAAGLSAAPAAGLDIDLGTASATGLSTGTAAGLDVSAGAATAAADSTSTTSGWDLSVGAATASATATPTAAGSDIDIGAATGSPLATATGTASDIDTSGATGQADSTATPSGWAIELGGATGAGTGSATSGGNDVSPGAATSTGTSSGATGGWDFSLGLATGAGSSTGAGTGADGASGATGAGDSTATGIGVDVHAGAAAGQAEAFSAASGAGADTGPIQTMPRNRGRVAPYLSAELLPAAREQVGSAAGAGVAVTVARGADVSLAKRTDADSSSRSSATGVVVCSGAASGAGKADGPPAAGIDEQPARALADAGSVGSSLGGDAHTGLGVGAASSSGACAGTTIDNTPVLASPATSPPPQALELDPEEPSASHDHRHDARRGQPAKGPRPKPPLAAAMKLQGALRDRVDRFTAWVIARIVDAWGSNARAHGPRHRTHRADASPWIELKLREAKRVLAGDSPANDIDATGVAAAAQNAREMAKLIPIRLREDPDVGPLLDDFREAALGRITSLDDDAIDELRDILEEAEVGGWRNEDLADEIRDRLEVTGSRAEFIARDQTLKLNAAITQHRQVASGITQFVWSTSEDERVRESHAELDGETFSWDDLPTVDDEDDVAPGTQWQCRCCAVPILPEEDVEEDEEDADESGEAEDELAIAAEE